MPGFKLRLVFLCAMPVACSEQLQIQAESPQEVSETSPLADFFDNASEEHDVPVDVLKAWAYVETRIEHVEGETELEGIPPPFGVFALRGDDLSEAAELTGLSVKEVESTFEGGIRAGAALLAAYADRAGITDRANPLAYGPALELYGGLDEEMKVDYRESILGILKQGVVVPRPDGTSLVVRRYGGETSAQQYLRGAAGARWLPSPNHSSRGGRSPLFVIIHTCEGSYAGCVSWLRNSSARVSAHYVVKDDGSEVAQLVDEDRKAWHISARYRSNLNGGAHPELDGVPSNNITIGIEHAGYGRQTFWPEAQISRSIDLVRDIIARNQIPGDQVHIVGHGQLQPENRTDPGAGWPWARYLADIAAGSAPAQPPPAMPPEEEEEEEPAPGPPPSPPPAPPMSAPPQVVTVDNRDSGRFRASSEWFSSGWAAGKVGADYRVRSAAFLSDLAEFKVPVPQTGRYEVFVHAPGNGYNERTPILIRHSGGESIVHVDMSKNGAAWLSVGQFDLAAGDTWAVGVSCWTNGSGYVIADAVRIEERP